MKTARNILDAPLHVPGLPEFAPKEVREVSDAEAAYLADCSNIEVAEKPAAPKKRPSSE